MQPHATEPLCTPRDLRPVAERVLIALARSRFVRVESLLAFARRLGLAPDLLDLWHAAGLVYRGLFRDDPVSGITAPFVALTRAGAKALATATGHTLDGISTARLKSSSQKRAHDVGVGELALSVLSLAEDGRIELRGLETDDRKLGTTVAVQDGKLGVRSVGLQPDALVIVRGERGPVALVVEVDRGTTSVSRLRQKFLAYFAWRAAKGPERDYSVKALRVLTIVPNARRLEKLRAAALAANGGKRSGFLLFTLAPDVTAAQPERLFEPIALRLDATEDARVPVFETREALNEKSQDAA